MKDFMRETMSGKRLAGGRCINGFSSTACRLCAYPVEFPTADL